MSKHDTSTLSTMEKRVIHALGGDLGGGARPFADLGRKLGLSEEEVVNMVRNLRERGLMRRFGATLRHQRSGFTANAMVAWQVPEDLVEEVGCRLAAYPEVTHCYQRRAVPGWSRNLYTMIHASSEEACLAMARSMAEQVGLTDYELLFSHEELKKTSMRYFA